LNTSGKGFKRYEKIIDVKFSRKMKEILFTTGGTTINRLTNICKAVFNLAEKSF
jgi:hypothetical protein